MTEKRRIGFALMSPDQLRAISSKGGTMGHLRGTAHCWSIEDCRLYGKKGGEANRGKPKPLIGKKPRGFAAWTDLEKRRHVAALGGKAAHAKGTAHEWTVEQARAAGRKGGLAGGKFRPKREVA